MRGYATAYGAATVLNAIANWKGSAFGISLRTSAEVVLNDSGRVVGDASGIDTTLIVRCVERVLNHFGLDYGGVVRTRSEIPVASGLKSSSAAANATVLATLDALGEEIDMIDAVRIGVGAALDAGVTVTGAFDDACASMLGGVVVTDNWNKELLKRDALQSEVVLLIPEERFFSRDVDVARCRLFSRVADVVFDMVMEGDYAGAMTLNGLLYCTALRRSPEPVVLALRSGAAGATLSGTGPAYAALVDDVSGDDVAAAWSSLGGRIIRTAVENRSARMGQADLFQEGI
ncbi:MAG TPA: shikimate kinase [Methanothrix sp.]|nr:shikimate kinase [Methanothrix sp.]HOK58591.1 shikimate kinase [Methanothrix sp.]HOL43776.1 shikimate kinase [Methanothrix sp.]HPO88861.1 shikimate kinase [Methanothrix sp.]